MIAHAAPIAAAFSLFGLAAANPPGLAAQVGDASLASAVSATVASTADLPDLKLDVPPAPRQEAARPRFATLADAVAAQAELDSAHDDAELGCLADAVYHEAKGEPLDGQLAVAQVIRNRANSGRFANSICGVIHQPGQFSFARDGHRSTAHRGTPGYKTAIAVAKVAMAKHWDSSAGDALYFHARRVSPGWRLRKVAAIGNQVFYR